MKGERRLRMLSRRLWNTVPTSVTIQLPPGRQWPNPGLRVTFPNYARGYDSWPPVIEPSEELTKLDLDYIEHKVAQIIKQHEGVYVDIALALAPDLSVHLLDGTTPVQLFRMTAYQLAKKLRLNFPVYPSQDFLPPLDTTYKFMFTLHEMLLKEVRIAQNVKRVIKTAKR